MRVIGKQNKIPKCYKSSSNVYPYCAGAKYLVEFAENNCERCELYRCQIRSIIEDTDCLASRIDICEMRINELNNLNKRNRKRCRRFI